MSRSMPVEERDEIARQVAVAQEAMRRYAPALRELAAMLRDHIAPN